MSTGPHLKHFRCIQLDQVKSEWLRGRKIDWAITSVHACIKPMSPKAVVQAQQHEQPIGQKNLPSIPYSKREQLINPICGYSNPFRPGISSHLEEFDEIFYTIKPWGYCGGAGGAWPTWLIIWRGPPRDWFPSTHIIPAYCICDITKSHPHISRPVIYVLQEHLSWTFVSVKNILPIATWTHTPSTEMWVIQHVPDSLRMLLIKTNWKLISRMLFRKSHMVAEEISLQNSRTYSPNTGSHTLPLRR